MFTSNLIVHVNVILTFLIFISYHGHIQYLEVPRCCWMDFKDTTTSILASSWKPEACGQTMLPDRSFLIGQKLVENIKNEELKCDIFSHFHTLWYDYFVLINKCNGGDSQTKIMNGHHLSWAFIFSEKKIRWDKWLMWRKTSIFKVFPPWVINMKVKWGQHLFSLRLPSLEKAFGRQI